MCAYGLSPFPQGQPCYAIVLEGIIGSLYHIDENVAITKLDDVILAPGWRYSYLYYLGSSEVLDVSVDNPSNFAGKLMAIAGLTRSDENIDKNEIDNAVDLLLNDRFTSFGELIGSYPLRPSGHADGLKPFHKCGLLSQKFRSLANQFQSRLFDRIFSRVATKVEPNHPLLISGGCGLNCSWNRRWIDSGLFSEVFVPPCTNDSGAAIGTAVDAQHFYTGSAKITWSVDSGQEFLWDETDLQGFLKRDLNFEHLSQLLFDGAIFAWVQGRCEMGPRALMHRSLIAEPFSEHSKNRLNAIKGRESYRPIAPVCLQEDVFDYFDGTISNEHMLLLHKVRSEKLKAVVHADGTARVQALAPTQNPNAFRLLRAFKQKTGFGVLCNTSLNFRGKGFINRASDVAMFCRENKLDGFVINDLMFTNLT
ncbi:MAG: carbamoyltransferase C-terminal domain-containing protein [Planctomycetota bacterium]